MGRLESSLIDSFVKATKPTPPPKSESFLYGTVQSVDASADPPIAYVIFDGSDTVTPCDYTVSVAQNDRVTAMFKNRKAVIVGNSTNPSVNFRYLIVKNALFDGTVEFVWTPDQNTEQHIYLGSENAVAPFLLTDTTAMREVRMQASSVAAYNTQTQQYSALTYTGIAQGSDARLKENITPCDPAIGMALKPVSYNFIGDPDNTHCGFIAQDVRELIPAAVQENSDGYFGLNYTELIAPILALVQEQEKRIEELERKVSDLEAERDQLSAYEKPLL